MIAQYSDAANKKQAAAETLRGANSIFEQFSQPYWVAYAQHALEGNGCQLAASVALAKGGWGKTLTVSISPALARLAGDAGVDHVGGAWRIVMRQSALAQCKGDCHVIDCRTNQGGSHETLARRITEINGGTVELIPAVNCRFKG